MAIDAQRQSLIQELAQAQNISVALATQRQQGLEQRRQEKIAEQRRSSSCSSCVSSGARRAASRPGCRQQRRIQHLRELRQQHHDQHNTPTTPRRHAPAASAAAPAGRPDPAAAERDGRPIAINFAYDQLGDPYVWGAAGPDSWDCSGLTMGAWAAAGVYLPHYSVAQYAATTPISVGQLRPGRPGLLGRQLARPGLDLPCRAVHR